MVCFNSRKHSNAQIYYSVESLEEALRKHKKVSFVYFDLNENRGKVYRSEKSRYIVDPVALVYNEDNYYLMCFSAKHNDVVNYRVDRMEQVRVEAESADQRAVIHASNVADYTEQAFKMYNGKSETVTLDTDRQARLVRSLAMNLLGEEQTAYAKSVCRKLWKLRTAAGHRLFVHAADSGRADGKPSAQYANFRRHEGRRDARDAGDGQREFLPGIAQNASGLDWESRYFLGVRP